MKGKCRHLLKGGGRCILFRFGLNNNIKYYTYNILKYIKINHLTHNLPLLSLSHFANIIIYPLRLIVLIIFILILSLIP